jgi:uncharacterized membrane protein
MANFFSTIGKIAGLGGLCIGLVLYIFRDIIRKRIFPMLPPEQAYRLLRLIVLCTFVIAVIGIMLWAGPITIGSYNRVSRL